MKYFEAYPLILWDWFVAVGSSSLFQLLHHCFTLGATFLFVQGSVDLYKGKIGDTTWPPIVPE